MNRKVLIFFLIVVVLWPFNQSIAKDVPQELIHNLNLSNKYYKEKEYNLAIDPLEKAQNIAEDNNLDDYLSTIYVNFGYIYFGLKNKEKSYNYFKKSLPLSRKLSMKNNLMKALSYLFLICMDKKQKEEALTYGLEVEPYLMKVKDYKSLLYLQFDIVTLYYQLGDYIDAKEYCEKAYESANIINNEQYKMRIHLSLGLILHYLGQTNLAIDKTMTALKYFQERKNYRRESNALNNLGYMYKRKAMYKEAIKYYHKAYKIMDKNGLEKGKAVVLSNIGNIYLAQTDYETAKDYFEGALKIHSKLKEVGAELIDQLNIINVYFYQEKYKKVLGELLIVLKQAKQLKDKGIIEIALNNIGNVYESMGNNKKALFYYEESFELIQRIGIESSKPFLLLNLGNLKRKLKRTKEAISDYQNALKIALSLVNVESLWITYYRLGECYEQMDQFGKAYKNYLKSINVVEEVRNYIIGGERSKTLYLEDKVNVYKALILLLMKMGKSKEAFEVSERVRARTFLDLIGQTKIDLRKNIPKDLKVKEELIKKRIIKLNSRISVSYGRDRRSIFKKIDNLQKEYLNLLEKVKHSNPEYVNLVSVSPLKLNEINPLINENKIAVIDYFLTKNKMYIWLIKKDFFKSYIVNVSQKEIEDLVDQFRYKITQKSSFSDLSWRTDLKKLYQYLIKPLSNDLAGEERIGIVPHLKLHYLPFEVLFDGKKYFLEKGISVFYLPSVSTYKFCLDKITDQKSKILAFGNPDLSEAGLVPLINAEVEVKLIANKFKDKKVLVRKEATETKFKKLAGKYDVIHLATHAALNIDNPIFSKIYLAKDKKNDGQLEVYEVFEMNLNSRIVVLSACQTALKAGYKSQFPPGDDLIGLSRSFIYAGTPRVIASLWKVADKPTAELMVSFYDHLKNKSEGEALTLAKIDILKKYKHPYFWAPFIIIGTD